MVPRKLGVFSGPWGGLACGLEDVPSLADLGLGEVSETQLEENLIHSLLRRSDSRGSDVRLDTGTVFRCQAWPRSSVDPDKWRWQPIFNFLFKNPQPINELELVALINLVRWKSRNAGKFGKRFLVLNDNQVVIAVTAKGRSSSHRLARLMLKYCSLVLATWSAPCLAYVRSSPADECPRRWSG